jgi:hypothetical protein
MRDFALPAILKHAATVSGAPTLDYRVAHTLQANDVKFGSKLSSEGMSDAIFTRSRRSNGHGALTSDRVAPLYQPASAIIQLSVFDCARNLVALQLVASVGESSNHLIYAVDSTKLFKHFR